MNWLGIIIFIAIGIFAVSQLVGFINDIKERRAKNKAKNNGTNNENGEDINSNEN